MIKPSETHQVLRQRHGTPRECADELAAEQALQIELDGEDFSVTMCSPGQERELVYGLLFSERIICAAEDVLTCEFSEQESPLAKISLCLRQPSENTSQKRRLASYSSCGLCGLESWKQDATQFEPLSAKAPFPASKIPLLFEKMQQEQKLFKLTGGVHAVAAFDANAQLLGSCEDIGRHNAMDKLIGSLLIQDRLSDARAIIVSGRISFEIISKCARAGVTLLAAVSASSSLAVHMAERAGITMLGFCRDKNFTLYSRAEGLDLEK